MAKKTNSKEIKELKELLLAETSNSDDTGLLHLASGHLTSDVHQRKIARVRELVNNL